MSGTSPRSRAAVLLSSGGRAGLGRPGGRRAAGPGAPGDKHTWAPADKHGFSTARQLGGNAYLTLRQASPARSTTPT